MTHDKTVSKRRLRDQWIVLLSVFLVCSFVTGWTLYLEPARSRLGDVKNLLFPQLFRAYTCYTKYLHVTRGDGFYATIAVMHPDLMEAVGEQVGFNYPFFRVRVVSHKPIALLRVFPYMSCFFAPVPTAGANVAEADHRLEAFVVIYPSLLFIVVTGALGVLVTSAAGGLYLMRDRAELRARAIKARREVSREGLIIDAIRRAWRPPSGEDADVAETIKRLLEQLRRLWNARCVTVVFFENEHLVESSQAGGFQMPRIRSTEAQSLREIVQTSRREPRAEQGSLPGWVTCLLRAGEITFHDEETPEAGATGTCVSVPVHGPKDSVLMLEVFSGRAGPEAFEVRTVAQVLAMLEEYGIAREELHRSHAQDIALLADSVKNISARTIMHHVKNGLAGLEWTFQHIQDTYNLPKTDDNCQYISDSVGQLQGRVQKLLLDVPMEPSNNLATLIHSCLEEASGVLAIGEVAALAHVEEGLPSTKVPAEIVKVVLLNLIYNSRCAIVGRWGHGGRLEIGAHLSKDGRYIIISVKDNGAGVAPDAVHELFLVPMRAGEARASGAGIGLWLSRRVLSYFRARITYDGQGLDGAGAGFMVELPVLRETEDPAL